MAHPVAVPLAPRKVRSILMGVGILLLLLIVVTMQPIAPSTFASPLSTAVPPLRGIHLGNHVNPTAEPWNASLLSRIDGSKPGGTWPDVIVVLSWQIYNRHRSGPDCRIDSVSILGSQTNVRDYLRSASDAQKRIIIRIMPSPGNFDTGHHLLTTSSSGCHEGANRSYNDIGDEIIEIHRYNAANGITEFGFEPANEPNVEWYRDEPNSTPILPSDQVAWSEMDAYFSAVYDYVHGAYPQPTVRVLTPPMGQGAYAELINLDGCSQMGLNDGTSGYVKMSNVFLMGTKNDGYDWHNYWRVGHEGWGPCYLSNGDHVAYNFPLLMTANMASKPRNITEADVASPRSLGQFGNIDSKDDALGFTVANSLNQFISAELSAERVAVWNLNVTEANPASEQNWHEAYCDDRLATDGVRARPWFTLWWTGIPGLPALCNHVFVSSVMNNYTTELIKNGNFDAYGAYWNTTTSLTSCTSPVIFGVISDTTNTGNTIAADLGRCNYNIDKLSQYFTIPDNVTSATLTYLYRVEHPYNDSLPPDHLDVQIHDYQTGEVVTLTTYTAQSPRHVWLSDTGIDLSARRGHNVEVIFKADNVDAVYPTNFWIDNVSVRITY